MNPGELIERDAPAQSGKAPPNDPLPEVDTKILMQSERAESDHA